MALIPYMSYWGIKKPNKFIINCHKLSAYYLRKNFGEAHFVTDSETLPYFKDIKWASTSTELDNLDKKYAPIWSLGKLHVYKTLAEKNIPFIHIDYDVFLWEGLPDRLKNSKLFAQNYENEMPHTYEKYNIKKFIELCPDLDIFNNPSKLLDKIQEVDPYVKSLERYLNSGHLNYLYKDLNAINVGIFGGSDFDFIKEYSDRAINFIHNKNNENFWLRDNSFKDWVKACISEQYYLSVLLETKNKKIDVFFDENNKFNIKNEGAYWIDIYYNKFSFTPDQYDYPYTHLMISKKRQDIQDKIDKLVKKLKL